MATYLSILRGINVSGHKMIKMTDLKSLYENIGFKNVTTYIQSGNVVFESKPIKNMEQLIEKKIAEKYNFEVPVITRRKEDMQSIVANNPFINQKHIEMDKLHVTFLAEDPSKANLEKITSYNFEPDMFIIKGKEVYLHCPNGYGNTKLNNTFFESKLKVKATTRNWKTTNALVEIMKGYN